MLNYQKLPQNKESIFLQGKYIYWGPGEIAAHWEPATFYRKPDIPIPA